MSILITRPEERSVAFAQTIEPLGYKTLIAPMLSVEPIPFDMPNVLQYSALIFTSAHGVEHFCDQHEERTLRVYTVGDHTANIAHEHGFSDIHCARGDTVALSHLIASHTANMPLLHIRGKHITESLNIPNLQIDELVMYEAKKTKTLTRPILDALQNSEVEAVTFFSKRTAENFLNLIEENGLNAQLSSIKALCISNAVLECVKIQTWLHAYASEAPNQDSVVQLLQKVVTNERIKGS